MSRVDDLAALSASADRRAAEKAAAPEPAKATAAKKKPAEVPEPKWDPLPPGQARPADVKMADVLTALKRRSGRQVTCDQLCEILGLDTGVPDNRHAVIWATSRLVEQKKITSELLEGAPFPRPIGYMYSKPKDDKR